MTNIKTMLEAEMEASENFRKQNFGLLVGDGFREITQEVLSSERVTGLLFIGLLMGSLGGKEIADAMKRQDQPKPDLGQIVRNNLNIFQAPLEMLYWGIQIGRKLQQEETQALREQRIQDILYVEAPKEYTATMYCAKCDDRTKVSQVCILFAWEPECENCGTTVPLSYAKVLVFGPEDQIQKHTEKIKSRAE